MDKFIHISIYLSQSLDIKVRDTNKRTNLGKIYLDKI
jgi:hypothetical protein